MQPASGPGAELPLPPGPVGRSGEDLLGHMDCAETGNSLVNDRKWGL